MSYSGWGLPDLACLIVIVYCLLLVGFGWICLFVLVVWFVGNVVSTCLLGFVVVWIVGFGCLDFCYFVSSACLFACLIVCDIGWLAVCGWLLMCCYYY